MKPAVLVHLFILFSCSTGETEGLDLHLEAHVFLGMRNTFSDCKFFIFKFFSVRGTTVRGPVETRDGF
jgi:hypothetical protein